MGTSRVILVRFTNFVGIAMTLFIRLRNSCFLFFAILRYNCNRYDEEEARAARDAQERSRSALQRYLFYCNRYMNHMQSLKFEHKLYASVKGKMEEMQHHNMSWIEVSVTLYRWHRINYSLNCFSLIMCFQGAISEKSRRYSMPMQTNVDVHVRVCVLFKKE